jgi:2-dehydro-3-deoxyphosphogluconate aldolase/(4S)-4-hydroxy-2-oxoglutarate aldolase
VTGVSTGRVPALHQLARVGVLPVAEVDDPELGDSLGDALVDAGLPCIEVTLRSPRAAEVLAVLAGRPELLVGAGTVTTPAQVELVVSIGASFVVSPGFSRAVVRECQASGIPVLPGVSTATEVMMALDEGVDVVKFFPAEACGGVAALSALSAPFPGVRFVPTGGITHASLPSYLEHPSVLAVGGSWMVARDLVVSSRFDEVTRLAREAVEVVSGRGRAGGPGS